jgi:hypothetical protein
MAAVGLVAGVPLGVATGRLAWTQLADPLGVINERVVPVPMLAAVVLVALAVAVLISIPARVAAARARPAHVLHAQWRIRLPFTPLAARFRSEGE